MSANSTRCARCGSVRPKHDNEPSTCWSWDFVTKDLCGGSLVPHEPAPCCEGYPGCTIDHLENELGEV